MSRFIDFDRNLTKQIINGNETAFKEVYSRHWKSIFGIAYSFLKSKQDSEDAVQDIFIQFWTKRENLSEQLDYKPYLFSIARNALINIVKSSSRRQLQNLEDIDKLGNNPTESEIEFNELSDLFSEAIDLLPGKRKSVFELKIKQGLNTDQIASEMNISKRMVQRHLKYAYNFIKEYLQSYTAEFILPFFFDIIIMLDLLF